MLKKKKKSNLSVGFNFVLHVAVVGGVTSTLGAGRFLEGHALPDRFSSEALAEKDTRSWGFSPSLPPAFCG